MPDRCHWQQCQTHKPTRKTHGLALYARGLAHFFRVSIGVVGRAVFLVVAPDGIVLFDGFARFVFLGSVHVGVRTRLTGGECSGDASQSHHEQQRYENLSALFHILVFLCFSYYYYYTLCVQSIICPQE